MTGTGKNAIDLLLAEALKEIAQKRPIEKITIKEITDHAGVIRPTFYNHFQDKYELMEWIINKELLEPIQPLLINGMVTEAMVLLFSNIEKDKAFYNKAVKMEGVITFANVANKCVEESLKELIRIQCEENQKKDGYQVRKQSLLTIDSVATYYGQSMCFAMMEWVKSGMTASPKEMAEAYTYMISHSMEEVVKEL